MRYVGDFLVECRRNHSIRILIKVARVVDDFFSRSCCSTFVSCFFFKFESSSQCQPILNLVHRRETAQTSLVSLVLSASPFSAISPPIIVTFGGVDLFHHFSAVLLPPDNQQLILSSVSQPQLALHYTCSHIQYLQSQTSSTSSLSRDYIDIIRLLFTL